MVAQWINELSWFGLMHLSNFKYIAINMPEIIIPALKSVTLVYPLLSLKQGIFYHIEEVMDCDQDWIDSFEDFKGFKLVPSKSLIKTPDVFMCNAHICIDDQTGKPAIIPEKKRYEAEFGAQLIITDDYIEAVLDKLSKEEKSMRDLNNIILSTLSEAEYQLLANEGKVKQLILTPELVTDPTKIILK
jgi:hypothetical protein